MPLESQPTLYAVRRDLEKMFSADGIELRSDDELEVVDDALEDATDLINQYCATVYTTADLATSRWVKRRCIYLACHFLSQRRGNPAQYQGMFDRIMAELKDVQGERLCIPRLETHKDLTPAMSNLLVDDRYNISKIRVQPMVSTGGNDVYQDLDRYGAPIE